MGEFMQLEQFNNFEKKIEFNKFKGEGREVEESRISSFSASGMCDFICGQYLALYIDNDFLMLQWSTEIINLDDPSIHLIYKHLDGAKTQFQVLHGEKIALSFDYPSWWTQIAFVPGLGCGPDDEYDFCAYLKFMMESEVTRKHLRSKYNI